MTKVTRHPNCRCGPEVGDNPYCVIHGRIRDMDAGASPFVDPDSIAASVAEAAGIEEEHIDRDQPVESVIADMHTDNLEQAMMDSFDALKNAAPEGCTCDYSQDSGSWGTPGNVKRHHKETCPVHGTGPRQDYDVEGEVEEI